MKYDPNFFMERDLFIQQCRATIEEKDVDEEWKGCMHEVISFWEYVMEIYRGYVDCYDKAEKKERRKVLRYAVEEFNKCLGLLQRFVEGNKDE